MSDMRRMMMMFTRPVEVEPVLPYDAKVEYLQSSGTQYIDTGIYVSSNNIEIDIDVYTENMPTSEQDIMGNQDSSTGRFVLGLYNKYVFGYNRSSAGTNTNVVSATFSGANRLTINIKYDYTNSTKTLTVNGASTSQSYVRVITNTNKTVKVFNDGRTTTGSYFSGRVYSVKFYQDGSLLADYIPVRVENIGYMYDKVSGNLLGNSGSGSFTYGNDVTN